MTQKHPFPLLNSLSSLPVQGVLLALLAIILYANTANNGFALDDGIVIQENQYTTKGLSGVGKLLTTDSFEGRFGDQAKILAGGRYRPLSLVTFAVEWQFYGKSASFAAVSHVVNTLLYALLLFVMLALLRRHIFKEGTEKAFFATFIFGIHPIHTEAIANLKGRDEILSLLFLLLTLYYLLNALAEPSVKTASRQQKRRDAGPQQSSSRSRNPIFLAAGAFFLALLSKEYGVTFLVLAPLAVYFFGGKSLAQSFRFCWPLGVAFAAYLALRFSSTGFTTANPSQDVLNAPFVYASAGQKFATIIYILGKYINMLFFPYPLSYDYSYNQIPYQSFVAPRVLLSLAIHAGLIYLAVALFKKRNPLSFFIIFYLASIFLVSNLVINIGAPMGERFLFQPSFAFACAVAHVLVTLLEVRLPQNVRRPVLRSIMAAMLIPSAIIITNRNKDWKDNFTLYTHDVQMVPGSAKAQKGCGEALLKRAELLPSEAEKEPLYRKSVGYYKRAIEIHPKFVDAWLDLGTANYLLNDFPACEEAWNGAEKVEPNNAMLKSHYSIFSAKMYELADKALRDSSYIEAQRLAEKSIRYNSNNAVAYNLLAIVKQQQGDVGASLENVQKAAELNTGDPAYFYNMGMAYGRLKKYAEAIEAFGKAVAIAPQNADYWYNLAGVNFNQGNFEAAAKGFEQTLKINPAYPRAKEGMQAARARLTPP